ncbi:MAG TPA: histidine kinase [Bacteroidales bacterium]|nr:histidine kinase [Bacteroidales bacterium]
MNFPSKTFLLKIILHPLALALPITLIIVYFLEGTFEKYNVEQMGQKRLLGADESFDYADINDDGSTDQITFHLNTDHKAAVLIHLHSGKVLDQWNMDGIFLADKGCGVGDVDNDGKKDIVSLYFRNDSAFLFILNPLNPRKLYKTDVFVDTINIDEVFNDAYLTKMAFTDLTGDELPEIVFAISAGCNLYPRKVYAYDLKNNQLQRSPFLAQSIRINEETFASDLNGDEKKELLFNYHAPGKMKNIGHSSIHDHSSFLLILDHVLNIWSPPAELSGAPSSMDYHVISQNDRKYVLFIFTNSSNQGSPSSILLFDPYRKKILKRIFTGYEGKFQVLSAWSDDSVAIVQNAEGKLFEIGKDLELKPAGELPSQVVNGVLADLEIDNLGKRELIFRDKTSQDLCIVSQGSNKPMLMLATDQPINRFRNAWILTKDSEPFGIAIHADDVLYKYTYSQNKFVWMKWPVYLMIYLGIFGLYKLSIDFRLEQMRAFFEKDKQIAELKLKTIRNQLDPHFTFNAINAIASSLYKEDGKTAYFYLTRFSKLMRMTMLYSDKILRSLDDEIEFTIAYLEIEKLRFRNKFNYVIEVEENIELLVMVPRMIIQSYAESAISNGLMHREKDGRLKIAVKDMHQYLEVRITDNGVGIEKSKVFNKDRAFKSMRLITQFIDLINSLNASKVVVEMYDLHENDEVCGTETLIKIPYGIKYGPDSLPPNQV